MLISFFKLTLGYKNGIINLILRLIFAQGDKYEKITGYRWKQYS